MLIFLFLNLREGYSATQTWDAGGGAGATNWSTGTNWNPDGAPVFSAGDTFNLNNINITSGSTSTMDTSNTLGTINIGDTNATQSWNLTGAGTLTLNGNGAAAAINQSSGTLGDTISIGTINLTGDLNLNNSSITNSRRLTISSNIASTAATGTQTISNVGTTIGGMTLSGIISDGVTGGQVALVHNNTGATSLDTLTLSGANTYTGTTTVSSGLLLLNHNTALGSTTGGTTVVSLASVALSNGIQVTGETITISSNSTNNAGALQANAGATATWAGNVILASTNVSRIGAQAAGTLTVSGAITEQSAGSSLTISGLSGTGTVILSAAAGSNTYTGTTAIVRGNLLGGATNTFSQSSVLDVGSTVASDQSTFDLNGFDQTIGGLQHSGNTAGGNATVTNSGALKTLTVNQSSNTSFGNTTNTTGAITGTMALTKSGSGTLSLTSANTYTGTTTVSAGAINIRNATSLGTTAGGTSVTSGAALQVQGGITVGAEDLTLNGSGVAFDGALRNISGTNNYGGLITLGSAARIGSDAGTLNITNAGTITGAGFGLTVTGAGDTEISSIIGTGSGTVTKNAAGTATLSGASTYTGATTVNAGTLRAGVATNAFGSNSAVSLANTSGAILNLNDFSNSIGSLAGGGTTGGDVALGTATLTTGGDNTNTSYAGVISGTGGVTKTGSGTQTLTGANTYTSTTTVSSGVLNIQNATALGTTAGGTSVTSGAALQVQGGITVGAEALTLNGTGVAANGAMRNISGTNNYGGLVTLGSATRINSDAGTLNLTNAGTITGAGFGLTVGGAGDSTINSIIGTGSGTVTKDGAGAATLSGASTYTGATAVNAGTLRAGVATNAFGSNSAVNLANTSGAILNLNDFSNSIGSLAGGGATGGNVTLGSGTLTTGGDNTSTSFAGSITGTGGITKSGSGTQTLTGTSNTFSGTTTVSSGTLRAGVANTLSSSSAVSLANTAAVTLDLNSFNNTIGSLSGGGTTGGDVSLGTATLTVGGDNTDTSYAGVISGTGDLVKTGTGTQTLTGTDTTTGEATVNGGTLVIGTALGGSWAGDVTVNNTGTLKGRGNIAGGLVLNSGATYSVGNSPGTQTVVTLTINAGSSTIFEIDGATPGNGAGFHDQVIVTGAATINGGTIIPTTVFSGSSGFSPSAGQTFTVITAGSVTGQFSATDNSLNPSGLSFITQYTGTSVFLLTVRSEISSVASISLMNLNSNQIAIARPLDQIRPSVINSSPGHVMSDAEVIYQSLGRLTTDQIPAALNQMNPEKLSQIPQLSQSIGAQIHNQVDRQMAIRRNQLRTTQDSIATRSKIVSVDESAPSISTESLRAQKKKMASLDYFLPVNQEMERSRGRLVKGGLVDENGNFYYEPLASNSSNISWVPTKKKTTPHLLKLREDSPADLTLSQQWGLGISNAPNLKEQNMLVNDQNGKQQQTPFSTEEKRSFWDQPPDRGGNQRTNAEDNPLSFFASIKGESGEVKPSEYRSEFDYWNASAVYGGNYALNAEWNLGLFVGYGHGSSTFNQVPGEITYDGAKIGGYAQWNRDGWFVDGSSSFGKGNYESRRSIPFLSQQARGQTEGMETTQELRAGKDLSLGAWGLNTSIYGQYARTFVDSYDETGSAARLHVSGMDQDSIVSGARMTLQRPIAIRTMCLVPQVFLNYQREWSRTQEIQARFQAGGNAFRVKTDPIDADQLTLGVGASWIFSKNIECGLSLETEVLQNDLQRNAAQFDFKFSF